MVDVSHFGKGQRLVHMLMWIWKDVISLKLKVSSKWLSFTTFSDITTIWSLGYDDNEKLNGLSFVMSDGSNSKFCGGNDGMRFLSSVSNSCKLIYFSGMASKSGIEKLWFHYDC